MTKEKMKGALTLVAIILVLAILSCLGTAGFYIVAVKFFGKNIAIGITIATWLLIIVTLKTM
mgnify:CR=1 FL=1